MRPVGTARFWARGDPAAIFGMLTRSGRVVVNGQQVSHFSAQGKLVVAGVGYVPARTQDRGIVAGMNVFENMTLSQLGSYTNRSVLEVGRERRWRGTGSSGCRSRRIPNMPLWQPVGEEPAKVLARPSGARAGRGSCCWTPDARAGYRRQEDVYETIREMSDDGVGIILVADTLEEAIGHSHAGGAEGRRIQKRFDAEPGRPQPFRSSSLHDLRCGDEHNAETARISWITLVVLVAIVGAAIPAFCGLRTCWKWQATSCRRS